MRAWHAALLLLAAALGRASAQEPDVENPGSHWKTLPPAEPGEWRWRFPQEKGETYAAYRARVGAPAPGRHAAIHLQPYLTRPPRDPQVLDRTARVLGAFFGRRVEILPPRALPARAYVRARREVSVAGLLPELLERLPDDALFLLAVTDRDLFLKDLDDLFGWGSMRHRVGVLSLRRVGRGPDEALARRRTLTLATHEACHLVSLPHCTFFGCLMNGVRTLDEADRRPAVLCPVCRAKLCWRLGLDPLARYATLREAYRDAGLASGAVEVRGAEEATRAHQER